MLIVCGDSHTSTHGALGALAFGIGATEVAHVLATQTLWQKKPLAMRITVEGRLHAVVHGPCRLRGTEVAIPDIRSGAALVIAALCGEGESVLRNSWHIERGYEDMVGKLASVGARIKSVSVESDSSGSTHTYE